MRSRKHGIIAIIFSIPFFMEQELTPGLFLAGLGIFLLYKWWKHPLREIETEIKHDSEKFKTIIPVSYPLHMEFVKFYSKYLRLSVQFPALKTTYKELVESMWLRLSTESDASVWKKIIRATDEKWPVPVDVHSILESKLKKVTQETKFMQEAMEKSF